jgi:glycerol-3-phosphate acyltransferase PlsY
MTTAMILQSILVIIGGYLLGSVSATYLVGRWLGGKDLRQYGSGSLGGSMVYEHVGRWAVVPVVIFDVLKATVPALLALYLGLGEAVAAAAGLAAAAGHNWPIYTHFHGGRGMGTFAGTWLAIFPPGLVWLTALVGVGWRLGDSAPWLLVSLVTMPILAHFLGGSRVVLPVSAAMILITFLKRLEANRRPLPPPGPERRRVILRRLLLDRDVADHEAWIRQEPQHEREAASSAEESPDKDGGSKPGPGNSTQRTREGETL